MGSTGSLLVGSTLASGVAKAGGAMAQASALRSQGTVQAGLFDTNSKLAALQADDAERRGNTQAMESMRKTDEIVGAQKSGYAAQGVAVNSGSAADTIGDTKAMGALDMITIKNNAYREAMGYRIQASDYTFRGKMTQAADDNEANNTLLTGGLNALSSGLDASYYAGGGGKKQKI